MLYVLIPVAWLALIGICWAACAMARRGDVELGSESSIGHGDDSEDTERIVWEDLTEPIVQDARRTTSDVYH